MIRQNKGTYGLLTYPVWLLMKWWAFGLMALAGTSWALWKGRTLRQENAASRLYESAVIATAYLLVISVFRAKFHRHELAVVPLLAVTGIVFFLCCTMSSKWRTALIAVGVLLLVIGFWPQYLKDLHIDLTSHIATARRFGSSDIPADFLFIIDGIEDESFLLFFGKLRQPVYDLPEAQAAMIDGTWHGLISTCDWPTLQHDTPGVRKIAGDSQVVEFVRN